MNPETQTTLDEAVSEVLGLLTGLDLSYDPELDRYRAITRQLNRAIRANALESEWSWYASLLEVGHAVEGEWEIWLPATMRPRIINDDAVRLVDDEGIVQRWAYFLPRDALHKYSDRRGLWCSVVRRTLTFSRPFTDDEEGMTIQVPVMREPVMFRLPDRGKTVSSTIRKQLVDFPYPDVCVARAAYYYAQSDPVMQPRAPTLEETYKNLMYQLIERDVAITDTPFQNTFILPLENGLISVDTAHRHPHAD